MGTSKGVKPNRYAPEFKAGAVRLVAEQGRPRKEVAAELGVCDDSLKNWMKSLTQHGLRGLMAVYPRGDMQGGDRGAALIRISDHAVLGTLYGEIASFNGRWYGLYTNVQRY